MSSSAATVDAMARSAQATRPASDGALRNRSPALLPASGSLTLRFGGGSGSPYTTPALEWLVFRGGELLASGAKLPLAFFSRGRWLAAAREWDSARCDSSVSLIFQAGSRPSIEVGPRPYLRLHGPQLYLGRQPVARFLPEEELWCRIGDHSRWAVIRIQPEA